MPKKKNYPKQKKIIHSEKPIHLSAWLYLVIASCFEICWTYSLKFANFREAFTKPSVHFFKDYHNLIPLFGYIGFGVCNIVFFSMALKQIPAAIAFAVWTSVAMIGVKLVDTLYFKQPTSVAQMIFMALILAGVIGLRKTSTG